LQVKAAPGTLAEKAKRGLGFPPLFGGFLEKLTLGGRGPEPGGSGPGGAVSDCSVNKAEPLNFNLELVERSVAVIVAVPGMLEAVILAL
jgi:hypothetical protein